MDPYDLVIIGAGSGNTILDERFESWRVAIVERAEFGGTCLNRGCVPTKMFIRPADLVAEIRDGARLGVDASVDATRWRDIRDRIFGRIDPIVAGGARFRAAQPHVDVHVGSCRFVGLRRLVVETADGPREISGKQIVIAAGSRPTLPDIPGLDAVPSETSDTIMRIDEVPRRLVILGGGFIASELAHVFDTLGSKVTIVTRGPTLLSHHDHEVATAFTAAVAERFDAHLSARVAEVAADGRGVALALDDGRLVTGDMLLVATGRTPNSDQLDLAATDVSVHHDGRIRTDDQLRTDADGIWALGDIRSIYMLKHVANHEAAVVRHNLLHLDRPISVAEDLVPHIVFSDPQVAAVGATEEQLRESGRPYLVGRRDYGWTAAGWALEDTSSFCKVLVDRDTDLILGGHIVGPHSSILVQLLVQAMRFGQTARQLAHDPMYPHPALTEVVEQALMELEEPTSRS